MSISAVALLKKAAIAAATDRKVLKAVGGVVLGIVIIIAMPVVAVISVFNGTVQVDTSALQQRIVAQLTSDQQDLLKDIETTMYDIEDAMNDAGFADRVKEAQVLYTLALYEYADGEELVQMLTDCFEEDQTDDELISKVNKEFKTNILPEDFTNVMKNIRLSDVSSDSSAETESGK